MCLAASHPASRRRPGAVAGGDAPPGDASLDFAAFARAPLVRDPFDHLVVPGFLRRDVQGRVRACFPLAAEGGITPAPAAGDGPDRDALGGLLAELRAPGTTAAFAEKFGLDLDPDALMIHLRSRCRAADGTIHTDSRSKVLTALLYLEPAWPHPGGRLRLLRGGLSLDDAVAEIAPIDGTLIAFRRSDVSWHGHLPHEGVRRVIMFNWMTSPAAARREERRHAVSAALKRVFGARVGTQPGAEMR